MHRNEVVFELGSGDVTAIRFGISPGYELCSAVAVLQQPNAHPLQWGWLRSVQRHVPSDSFDVLKVVIAASGYFPDFLTSPPTWAMTPADEVAAIRGATLGQVRIDLGKVRDRAVGARRTRVQDMLTHPATAINDIADAWEHLWQHALAPHWDTLHRVLAADIAYRSRITAKSGLAAMTDELHERVTWSPDQIRVRMSHWSETVRCQGNGLLLVPTVLGYPDCAVLTEPPVQPTLFYPVHGLTERWPSRGPRTMTALAALMGEGRARVLHALDNPRTTSDTASACGLAISTASRHLSLLRDAGLVDTARSGTRALHSRTLLGDLLMTGPDPGDPPHPPVGVVT